MPSSPEIQQSDAPVGALVDRLRPHVLPLGRETAARVVTALWRKLSVVERAYVAADWSYWARAKQLPPPGAWRTWGFLTGRGTGKTRAVSSYVNAEVQAGRVGMICLAAQDEQSAVDLQITGPSGLIATAPPWFRPSWEIGAMRLTWPNGARAHVRTPEVPGKIRGLEYHLSWISELQSWPRATREEAFHNFFISTRLRPARIVWDSTPKMRNPLLKELVKLHKDDPSMHHCVEGSTHENEANLSPGYVAELERQLGKGTQRALEEIYGKLLEDSEFSLVKQAWIQTAPRPDRFVRRVIAVDPAVSDKKGCDSTGIVEAGLGPDGRAYILHDATAHGQAATWIPIVIDRYVANRCDYLIAETNKGGTLLVQLLNAVAAGRGLEVIVIKKEEARPRHIPGRIFVQEVFARGSKEERASPMAAAYERGRVVHVEGADLVSLEDTIVSWMPGPNADSPGDLDALVHAVAELLNLSNDTPDPSAGFVGIAKLSAAISKPLTVSPSLSRALTASFAGGRGDRI